VPPVLPQTLEVGRAGAMLTGIAGSAAVVLVALTDGSRTARTTIEAHRLDHRQGENRGATAPAWHTELDGHGGPLATTGRLVIAALGGTSVAGIELRGEPGAAVVALDAATGAIAWRLALDATEWSVIASLATAPDGVLVGGSFSGTLRVGAQVVSSAGRADGFVARITATGQLAWLIRVGGPGADAVQGVATSGDRIAIAGTFAAGADLRGLPLSPFDERLLAADGFVAELDATGAARWAQTFGGKADEAVAGVAIDASGRIAVAASVRDTVHVGGADLVVSGPADGLVAWWTPSGAAANATLIGGADFDGLRAIAPAGDHVVVGGFYSGSLRLGAQALAAAGGDDAFLAELDPGGSVIRAWPVSGEGREEITALAAIPGGFIAGVSHTAATTIGPDTLPAPADPLSGAAIVIRPVP
jgi:outer membrane protein assembly factor BamB